MPVAILLFTNFQTLDVFGPVEIFGRLDKYRVKFYSLSGGKISNLHGVSIDTLALNNIGERQEILLIPGGAGTRVEINNQELLAQIRRVAELSNYVLSVCTGSALLAKTGLLDGLAATSNRRAFSWVVSTNPKVVWDGAARWTAAGKFYTSAGVSAGMDMCLAFLRDNYGIDFARNTAAEIEYRWNEQQYQLQ